MTGVLMETDSTGTAADISAATGYAGDIAPALARNGSKQARPLVDASRT
jgi:hypothetical protein